MYLAFAPQPAREMIGGWGALSTVSVLLAPVVAAEAEDIGRWVSTAFPPNAVPSVLMNTSRMSDIVAPAGNRREIRTQRAVSVHSGSVECRSAWYSGEPASGPTADDSSVIRTGLVNG